MELERRLRRRATDSPQVIEQRLRTARAELRHELGTPAHVHSRDAQRRTDRVVEVEDRRFPVVRTRE